MLVLCVGAVALGFRLPPLSLFDLSECFPDLLQPLKPVSRCSVGGFGSSCSVVSVRSCFAWLSLRLSAPAFASPYCVRPHAPYFDCQCSYWLPPHLLRFVRPLAVLLSAFRLPESVGLPRCPPWWLPPVNIISNRAIPVNNFLHYMEGKISVIFRNPFKPLKIGASEGLRAVIFSGIKEGVKHPPLEKPLFMPI